MIGRRLPFGRYSIALACVGGGFFIASVVAYSYALLLGAVGLAFIVFALAAALYHELR